MTTTFTPGQQVVASGHMALHIADGTTGSYVRPSDRGGLHLVDIDGERHWFSTVTPAAPSIAANLRKAADMTDALIRMGQDVISVSAEAESGLVLIQVFRMLLCEEQVQRLCLAAGVDHRVDPVTVLTYTSRHDAEVFDFPGVRVFTLTPLSSPVGTFDPDVLTPDCESVGA